MLLVANSGNPNGETRMQAILAYNWTNPEITSMRNVAAQNMDDIWLQRALLMAAPNGAADLASAVVYHSRKDAATAATRTDFLRQLALNVAVRGDVEQLEKRLPLLSVKVLNRDCGGRRPS